MRIGFLILAISMILTGCGSSPDGTLGKTKVVSQHLNKQLNQWKGTPYRYGGNSRQGIDCSAFVQQTFANKFKLSLPRTTTQQANVGKKVSRSNLKAGDLVFFKISGAALHVGIYDKNNHFIHASTSQGVTRSSLNNTYWDQRYWQARRM